MNMKTTSKVLIILVIALVGCSLMSCQPRKGNIELTDFTKEFISLYVNHSDNFFAKNRRNEVLIRSSTGTLHYNLSILFWDLTPSWYSEEEFLGQTFYSGYRIRVFGKENPILFTVKDDVVRRRRQKDVFLDLSNPNIWGISLHKKDMSLCKIKTFKTRNYRDVSDLENFAKRFFTIADTVDGQCVVCGISHWWDVPSVPMNKKND